MAVAGHGRALPGREVRCKNRTTMNTRVKTVLMLAPLLISFCAGSQAQTLANYQAAVNAAVPSTYFTLDNGSLIDTVTGTVTLTANGITGFPTTDVYGNSSNAFAFVSQNDALDIMAPPDLISGGGVSNTTSTASGSVSILFRTIEPNNTGQRYIFSAGGFTTNHNAFELFVENTNAANTNPNSLKLRFGDSTTTLVPSSSLAPDSWYYFAVTYLESRSPHKAVWYVGRPGGVLASGVTSNAVDAVAGDVAALMTGDTNGLYFGNNAALASGLRNPGVGAVDEMAIWNHEITSNQVAAQFNALPNLTSGPEFAYRSVISSESPDHYFKFDAAAPLQDSVSPLVLTVTNAASITNGFDYFGNSSNCMEFVENSTSSSVGLVAAPNFLQAGGTFTGTPGSGKGTISGLFRSLASTTVSGQKFIFSGGGNAATSNSFGLYYENDTATSSPGALKLRFGNNTVVLLPATNFVPVAWYYFAVTFDESLAANQVNWYLGQPNGVLSNGVVTALAASLAGDGNLFVFGNNTNFTAGFRNSSAPTGNGEEDEFAFWHRVLSSSEINAQFTALTANVSAPQLAITPSGANVLVSWPTNYTSLFGLESTASLSPSSWSPVGGSTAIVGTSYQISIPATPTPQFYRLHYP
jgi:hypothetical protein